VAIACLGKLQIKTHGHAPLGLRRRANPWPVPLDRHDRIFSQVCKVTQSGRETNREWCSLSIKTHRNAPVATGRRGFKPLAGRETNRKWCKSSVKTDLLRLAIGGNGHAGQSHHHQALEDFQDKSEKQQQ